MAQIRGTAGYHLGPDNRPFGGPSHSAATSDPSPLDAIREQTSKIEDFLDTIAEPVKPWVFLNDRRGCAQVSMRSTNGITVDIYRQLGDFSLS